MIPPGFPLLVAWRRWRREKLGSLELGLLEYSLPSESAEALPALISVTASVLAVPLAFVRGLGDGIFVVCMAGFAFAAAGTVVALFARAGIRGLTALAGAISSCGWMFFLLAASLSPSD